MQRYVADYHQSKEESILFELLEKKGVSEYGCCRCDNSYRTFNQSVLILKYLGGVHCQPLLNIPIACLY